jgi:DedD protein
VERQLKERLIGAAVLVAVAVIMVPEMFSGPDKSLKPATDAATLVTNQVKTYRVELQASQPSTDTAPVEPPAERPLDEARAMQANPESSQAAPPDEQKSQTANTQHPSNTAVTTAPTDSVGSVKAETKPETVKPVSTAIAGKSATGGWAVQVGSFSAQDKAEQIAAKLKGQGYPAFVGSVKVNGKTLYRVRVGAMADRAAADATLQKLRGSYPGASVIAPGR